MVRGLTRDRLKRLQRPSKDLPEGGGRIASTWPPESGGDEREAVSQRSKVQHRR